MRNVDVIEKFLNKEAKGKVTNLRIESQGRKLINYNTALAQWNDDGSLTLNTTKYSSSTSRIQTQIKHLVNQKGIDYKEVKGILMHTWELQ